jgi:hypothetical protein
MVGNIGCKGERIAGDCFSEFIMSKIRKGRDWFGRVAVVAIPQTRTIQVECHAGQGIFNPDDSGVKRGSRVHTPLNGNGEIRYDNYCCLMA